MKNIPRASLCITILTDEDQCTLLANSGGLEAFAVFVLMVILGRERLQQGKARQIPGTDSLVFDNGLSHLTTMSHVSRDKLDACLETLACVSEQVGGDPWMYLDETSRLVIRSFFKYNAPSAWGGQRGKPSKTQTKKNLETNLKNLESNLVESAHPDQVSSGRVSVSVTVTDSNTPQPPQEGECGVSSAHSCSDDDIDNNDGPGEFVPAPLPPIDETDITADLPALEGGPEPFVSPGSEIPDEPPPPVQNDPAEVQRVAAKAERLFPGRDAGKKVREVSGDWPMAHVSYALEQAHSQSVNRWQYILGILRRLDDQGFGPHEVPSGDWKTAVRAPPERPLIYHQARPNSIHRRNVPKPKRET